MNIIRTTAVELSSVPAIAYKQKLSSGGAGLRILRLDADAAGIFTVDKRTGLAIPYGDVDKELFPQEAVDEALELTLRLPFSSRGKIKVSVSEESREQEDVTVDEPEAADMVDSDEYNAVVDRYSDEKGKVNYRLMNKDFIQFASKSKMVGELVGKQAPEDEILAHIVRDRASFLANSRQPLNDAQVAGLMETLDEIDTRGAFKELKAHIRRMLAK